MIKKKRAHRDMSKMSFQTDGPVVMRSVGRVKLIEIERNGKTYRHRFSDSKTKCSHLYKDAPGSLLVIAGAPGYGSGVEIRD